LRINEEQYRLLFDVNPCPMWICDKKTLKFLNVNGAALRLYGWPRKEFLRMTAKDICPREDVPRFVRVVSGLREPGVVFVGEWRHLKQDGRVFDAAVTISSIPYAGRAARLVLINDITEPKRAEALLQKLKATLEPRVGERAEELSDANAQLQAIMGTALIGIITLDERGIIKSLNPAAGQIFGYAPDELVGRGVSRLLVCTDRAPRESFLGHYPAAGAQGASGVRGEVLGRSKDGRPIVLESSAVEFSDGGRRQVIVMVRDITQRKRLERELLEAGERERQRLGHDLHDGLGQHLHALFYMATLLETELKGSSPERAQEAGRLARQLEHGLELVRSLARGLQPVNPVPEGLMAALRELSERTRALYRVDSHFQCPAPVLIHRHSAANHLYRIAQEAVNNSMKHGKPTRLRVKLTATPKRIVLGIRDDGRGIGRRSARSQGMGLQVMQYRAETIGGSLAVQRHPQGGTEVVCTIARRALLPQEENLK